MVTKENVLNGLDMYHKRLKTEIADAGKTVIGTKPSTVEGAMWFSVDDDLYWSVYVCMRGQRIEIAYGQLRSRN